MERSIGKERSFHSFAELEQSTARSELFGCQDAGAEQDAGGGSAQGWNEKKDPQLLEGLAADKEGGAEASRRVYAGAGDVDAEQMDDN
jgi:hypothetical protein